MPVTIDTTGLAPGVYSSDVRVQSANAEVNPSSLPVVLVTPGAVVQPLPSTVTMTLPTPNTGSALTAGTGAGGAVQHSPRFWTCKPPCLFRRRTVA